MKVPDSGRIAEQVCLSRYPDIGRANRYEQEGRKPGLRQAFYGTLYGTKKSSGSSPL